MGLDTNREELSPLELNEKFFPEKLEEIEKRYDEKLESLGNIRENLREVVEHSENDLEESVELINQVRPNPLSVEFESMGGSVSGKFSLDILSMEIDYPENFDHESIVDSEFSIPGVEGSTVMPTFRENSMRILVIAENPNQRFLDETLEALEDYELISKDAVNKDIQEGLLEAIEEDNYFEDIEKTVGFLRRPKIDQLLKSGLREDFNSLQEIYDIRNREDRIIMEDLAKMYERLSGNIVFEAADVFGNLVDDISEEEIEQKIIPKYNTAVISNATYLNESTLNTLLSEREISEGGFYFAVVNPEDGERYIPGGERDIFIHFNEALSAQAVFNVGDTGDPTGRHSDNATRSLVWSEARLLHSLLVKSEESETAGTFEPNNTFNQKSSGVGSYIEGSLFDYYTVRGDGEEEQFERTLPKIKPSYIKSIILNDTDNGIEGKIDKLREINPSIDVYISE